MIIHSAALLTAAWLGSAPVQAQLEGAGGSGSGAGGNGFSLRNWSLQLRAYGGYDSNVLLVPDRSPDFDPRGKSDSAYLGLSASGSVHWLVGRGTTLGLTARADRVQYLGHQPNLPNLTEADDPTEYSLTVLEGSVFLRRDFGPRGRRGAFTFAYSFHHEDAKIEAIGLDGHTISASLDAPLNRRTTLRGRASYSWNNYYVDFRPIAARDRDGQFLALDLGVTHRITPRQTLSLGAGYVRNDAGADWDYRGWRANAGFTTHVAGPVYARADASYTHSRFRGGFTDLVPAPGRTRENLFSWGLSAAWYLRPNLLLDLGYRSQNWTANLPQFEGDRRRVSAGISWTM